jgi:uncharacterized protein (DUF1778 family)
VARKCGTNEENKNYGVSQLASQGMDVTVKVRLTKADRALFEAAAKASRLTLSAWVRSVVAQEALKLQGQKVIA